MPIPAKFLLVWSVQTSLEVNRMLGHDTWAS
jgi:hypothetical protein